MITGVDTHGPKYAELGVASVTFHIEASENPLQLSREIRARGSRVAAAVKPNTPVTDIAELMPELDMVLVMTVEPGFGGQKLIESTIAKVTQARELSRSKGLEIAIQVDGGVTEENIQTLALAGADTFVAGSSVFKAVDRNRQIDLLRTLAQQAVRG
jgi:ribulose-phosphate 3-epimerase